MNTHMKSEPTMNTRRNHYGVFVSSHHLLNIRPESTCVALADLFPERNAHEIMAILQQGKKCLVREGKHDCLDAFVARIYSQGFQVEVLPLD